MPLTPLDPVALRSSLERQLELIAPVAFHLDSEARYPPHVPSDSWRGPAAERCRLLEAELAELLRRASETAESTVARLRSAVAALS